MFITISQTIRNLSPTVIITGAHAHHPTLYLDMNKIADSNDILHLQDAGMPLSVAAVITNVFRKKSE
jgi:hypothetical protein